MKSIVQLHFKSTTSGDFSKRLHEEFLKIGIQSSMVALSSELPHRADQISLGLKERLKGRVDYQLNAYLTRKANPDLGLFTYPVFGTNVARLPLVRKADVIYVHWIHQGFMNHQNLEQLAKLGKPVVVVLHDMWYMTGGCHYSFDCTNYQQSCQNCRFFAGSASHSLASSGFKKKKKLYNKYPNFYFVSPSKWMYECAAKSSLLQNKPLYHIPNVLDRGIFKPFGKNLAKNILNIDPGEKVILFGAVSLNSPYKGWPYLKEALQVFKQQQQVENISVIIFGTGHQPEMAEAIPFPTRFMGRIKDEYTLALVYNAADVFIAPSLADNLPYTIFEALACGTPVVAFNTGGIPDLIRHQVNGYLASPKNAEELAQGLTYCLSKPLSPRPPAELDNQRSMEKHLALLDSIKTWN